MKHPIYLNGPLAGRCDIPVEDDAYHVFAVGPGIWSQSAGTYWPDMFTYEIKLLTIFRHRDGQPKHCYVWVGTSTGEVDSAEVQEHVLPRLAEFQHYRYVFQPGELTGFRVKRTPFGRWK